MSDNSFLRAQEEETAKTGKAEKAKKVQAPPTALAARSFEATHTP